MKKLAILFLMCGCLLLSMDKTFAAEERVGDWFVNCHEETKQCAMIQELIMKQDDKQGRLASLAFFKEGDVVKGRFVTPLGIYLIDGLFFKIDDGKKYKTNLEACAQQGCFVTLNIEDPLLGQLQKGTTLHLFYSAQPGQQLETKLSLKGFTKAYEKTFGQ